MEKQKKRANFIKERKDRIIPLAILSLAVSFMMFLSIPIEIYYNNIAEFSFDIGWIVWQLVLLLAVSSTVIFAIMFLLPKRAYKILSPILLAITLMLFLESTYLGKNLTSLEGDKLGTVKSSNLLNTTIWVLAIGAITTAFLTVKKEEITKSVFLIVSVVILLTQIVSPLSMILSGQKQLEEKRLTLKSNQVLTDKNFTQISTKNNIYIFSFDKFDGRYFKESYIKDPKLYEERFKDFTYFSDNISLYGRTFPSLTYMLTTQEFDVEKSRLEYYESAFSEKTKKPLEILDDNGYSVNLFIPNYYAYENANSLPDFIANKGTESVSAKSPLKISLKMTGIAGYRAFPKALKGLFGSIDSNSINANLEKGTLFTTETSRVNALAGGQFSRTDKSKFTFIHTEGFHEIGAYEYDSVPSIVNENLQIFDRFVKELKDLGVYDSSIIIVTADHGAPRNDQDGLNEPGTTALFIKKPFNGDSGQERMVENKAQVSNDDLWATIFDLAGIETEQEFGMSMFDIDEGENRERRHVWHTHEKQHVEVFEYKIIGDGWDFNNWKLEKRGGHDKYVMD